MNTTTRNQKVVLLNRSETTPIFAVGISDGQSTAFSGNTNQTFYFGLNRIPGQVWAKIQNNKVFMDSLKQMESRGEIEFIELAKGEDDNDITTIKDLQKAKKLAKFEFCGPRLRRWVSAETRAGILEILDQNLSFIISANLENEERQIVCRRFVSKMRDFERKNSQNQSNKFVKQTQEW